MPEIHLPKKILFGKDKINELSPDGCEHAIILCDSEVFESRGFLEALRLKITKIISHVSVVVNSDISTLYNSASEIFFQKEADLIIAAGSGRAVDCGMLLSHESKAEFIAIPCCSACAMTDFEHNGYYSYRHSPDTVILDPSIIRCMPSATLAYDGMACFAYAVDSLNNTDNVISHSFALQGATGILKNIIPAYRGDIVAQERLLYSMYFAVVAHRNGADLENSDLSKASNFFSDFGYPRASVCALIFPNIMENEERVLRDDLYRIAIDTGVAHENDNPEFATVKLIDEIRKIQAAVGIPRAVSGFGLNENEYRNKKSSTTVNDDLLDLCYYGSFKFMKL